MGNAAAGVHMGALGGLWQAAVFGVAGLGMREEGIVVDPHLLPGWRQLAFPLQWRGRSLRLSFEADPRRIEVVLKKGGRTDGSRARGAGLSGPRWPAVGLAAR
jgi:kojibiose phosphorylase